MARAVPLNDKWHDTIFVNVCDMYWPDDEALPDLSPGATIHICAMRYVKEDEEGYYPESKTPWEYVLWYSVPGPVSAVDQDSSKKQVTDAFYGN